MDKFESPEITLTNLLVGSPPLADPPLAQNLDENLDEDDIYRGPDPRSPIVVQPSTSFAFNPMATRSSTTSSSSSSSSSSGMRFNIIPSVIEHAISRWARGRGLRRRGSFSSESTGDTTTSTSSESNPRRRRKRSPASIRSHTTSITTRRQLRAMSRASPREFILLLPPHLTVSSRSSAPLADGTVGHSKRELRTGSLELMMAQLAIALKRNAKTQRPLRQGIVPTGPAEAGKFTSMGTSGIPLAERRRKVRSNGPHVAFDISAHQPGLEIPTSNMETRKRKGKLKEVPRQFFLQESKKAAAIVERDIHQSCWWLDVASPTWDDMRALGKLLQLHPLTLEDILQKESREKFELFPRLGYYFVVFRAVERPDAKLMMTHEEDETSSIDGLPELTEVLEVTNIYLVVFKEGICVFHFEDISMHMDAVKKKVLQLEGTIPMGSDWIAHGLMDSIVDGFFPVLLDIEKDVLLVENFVSELEIHEQPEVESHPFDTVHPPEVEIVVSQDPAKASESSPTHERAEKMEFAATPVKLKPRSLNLQHYIDLWRHLPAIWRRSRRKKHSTSKMSRDLNRLRRMTATRRLVTTLGRLLSSKAEVVGQIRKRLDGQGEVAIYLGDVLDHIISLHQSLVHYERLLSHSHPTYLSHLRFSLSSTKGGIDEALVILALVSILVVCSQIVVGLGSLNVNVPRSNDSFHYFGIFWSVAFMVPIAALMLVRYWYVKAKGRRGKMEEI